MHSVFWRQHTIIKAALDLKAGWITGISERLTGDPLSTLVGKQWPRAFAYCLIVLIQDFIVCDYLLMWQFVRTHIVRLCLNILLVWDSGVSKSGVARQVRGRDLVVDVA